MVKYSCSFYFWNNPEGGQEQLGEEMTKLTYFFKSENRTNVCPQHTHYECDDDLEKQVNALTKTIKSFE